ncbi:RodZ domain-containing protein [Paracoccus pacificus]|uniref:RodZ domain-containing protein n=1 Tax=Paracoccus pacificus TaxID=1463598 RepID=A0ABW4R885_9RHOB
MNERRENTPADYDQPSALPGFDDYTMRLGDLMRGERATLGKSLLDVQRELRIRASYVAAIENCDITAFDTPSFISGYVRSYSRYLGLDPDATFARFCVESGFQPVHGMAAAASGPKPQRRPSDPAEALANPRALFIPQPESFWSSVEPRAVGSVLVLVTVLAGLAYGGWSVLQQIQQVNVTPGEHGPGAIAALDPVESAAHAAQGDGAEDVALNLPTPEVQDRIFRPATLEVPVLVARDGPISAIDPGLRRALEQAQASTAAQPGAPENPAGSPAVPTARQLAMGYGPQLPQTAPGAVRTIAPDAAVVELLAVRPAWVRVTSADGTVLLEKTMDKGERFVMPKLEKPPVLRAGNSGAVYFAVNGQTYGPAAPGAQVVKNIEMSPVNLSAKFAIADLSKDADLAEMVSLASVDPNAVSPETTNRPDVSSVE